MQKNDRNKFSEKEENKPESDDSSFCKKIFREMDADGDGRISKKEFIYFLNEQRKEQRKRNFPADGTLSPLDKAILSVAGKNLEDIFNSYDTDHDGYISGKEAGLPESLH
jgi:Ca2+-binding EF-hand superfamily protein